MTRKDFFDSQIEYLTTEAAYLESSAEVFAQLAVATRVQLEQVLAFKATLENADDDVTEGVPPPEPIEITPEVTPPPIDAPRVTRKSLEDFESAYAHSQVLPSEATTDKQRKIIYATAGKLFSTLKGVPLRQRTLLAISNILGVRVDHISKLHTDNAAYVVDSFVRSCKERGLWDESR